MTLRRLAPLALLLGCTSTTTSTAERAIDGDPFVLERAAARGNQELEPALDAAIATGYGSRDTRVVVRHALVHWARLVRRHLDEPLHTAVPGLIEDPDCVGSVIGDQALVDYAQGVADGKPDTATAGLQTLARHMACLGEAQASHLATQMAIAFDDVESTLGRNGRADALPYLAQALAQPMLIVQDVERQHGANTPLARWFTEHAALLSEGAGGFHHPATWNGIWLYDRSLGRLAGFRATLAEETPTENTVELSALYELVAIARPEDNACSLAEVVRRGRGVDGYACKGQRCANEASADCRETTSADSTSGDANGLSLPGLVTQDVLACVASQVVRPGQQQMTCVLEASGHAAKPREQLVKDLTAVPLAGVKVGKECTISQGASDPYDAAIQAARDKYEKEVAGLQAELTRRIEELERAQAIRDADFQAFGPDNNVSQAAQTAVENAAELVNLALESIDASIDDAAHQRDATIHAVEEARAAHAPVPDTTHHCDPRAPIGAACGNGCGAMARQAAAFAACFVDKPGELDPYRGQCGLSCDPSEPTVDAPASAGCLESLEVDQPNRIQARECWAVRCGNADQSADGCCGPEQKTITGAAAFPDLCARAHCEGDTVPTVVHGRCECTGTYDVPGGPRIPFGPEPRP